MQGAQIIVLRDFDSNDDAALGGVALAAFEEFRGHYSDWNAMAAGVSRMAALAKTGEIIVAARGGQIVGGVAYVGPHKPKAAYFEPAWPIIRMLVVTPAARGNGLGRRLTQACIDRAKRDASPIIALHTTPIMNVALSMYLRMGFTKVCAAPDIYGVPYAVYATSLL
jgi:GNAT superfamily N-acetyltransferase